MCKDCIPLRVALLTILDAVDYTGNGEIEAEQRHGRKKWGGNENSTAHDDQHKLGDWLNMIYDHHQRAKVATPMEARQELIKIAGLAKSAVESMDRKNSP